MLLVSRASVPHERHKCGRISLSEFFFQLLQHLIDRGKHLARALFQVVDERYIASCRQLAQTYDQVRRTNQGEQRYHLMRHGRNLFQITVIKTFLQAFSIQPGLGSKTFEDRLRSLGIVIRKGGQCREVITMR